MRTHRYAADSRLIKAGLKTIGLPVAFAPSATYDQPLSCHLYRNPDGSIRWLWPSHATQPDFLRFYHRSSWRARLFVGVVQCLFRLKLGRWVAHDTLTMYTTEAGTALLQHTRVSRWALFTGTVGPNRKLAIWFDSFRGKSCFLKIALAEPAIQTVRREALALQQLQAQPFRLVDVPVVFAHGRGILLQEDLGTVGIRPVNQLTDLPAGVMRELSRRHWHRQPLRQAAFWQQAHQTLADLRATNDPRLPVTLLDKVNQLMQHLEGQPSVALAAAHGDFTPWNLLLRHNRLCVIDWELQHDALPALYDLFHFIYQSHILIGNRGYGSIRQAIERTLNEPEWQLFCEQQGVDPELAELLYLIHTLTYYGSVYSRQPNWHRQIHWLLATWNDALTHWLHRQQVATDRQLLLADLAFWLHDRPHAALKLQCDRLANLPDSSDLDLCLPRPVAAQLTAYLRQHPLAHHLVAEPRTFMNQLHLFGTDGSCLHVDLIWQFKRKQLDFMPAEPVWQEAKRAGHGLNVPSLLHTQTYLRLFYGLNNAPMPDRYRPLFSTQPDNVPSPADLTRAVQQRPANRGWQGLCNRLAYGWDTLRSFAFRRGLIVTFSGVDGAGKSTVIEQTRHQIEKRLRQRVVVLRHRPSLLPILSAWKHGKAEAEQRAASTLPRQGTNQSRLSSLLRFAYYYTDYLLGQFYVQVKYVWRGYIVLYDRYYFDFINDGRRSNINLPTGLVTGLYGLLLKPRLNVFLYAPADDILRRKQELDAATITELTGQYLRLFERLQKRYPSSEYLPVLNQHLPRTLNQIFDRIQTYSL